jgi:hypothetical protein
MAKKQQKDAGAVASSAEAPAEAPAEGGASEPPRASNVSVLGTGMRKLNPHRNPVRSGASEAEPLAPISRSYDDIQRDARGPGVAEWKELDQERSKLRELYDDLKEDERYSAEHKAKTCWSKYEEVRAKVDALAPEARAKMLKSAEGLERMSVPTPEGEHLYTKDVGRLLLTAHERNRLESLINHQGNAKGPFKVSPMDTLAQAYARGLDQGGPGGGATVRAVYEYARDHGLDIDGLVDAHRKPHHHGALRDADAARYRADLIGTTVPEPPFESAPRQVQRSPTPAFLSRGKGKMLKGAQGKKPYWR